MNPWRSVLILIWTGSILVAMLSTGRYRRCGDWRMDIRSACILGHTSESLLLRPSGFQGERRAGNGADGPRYMTSFANDVVFAELYYTQKIIKDLLGVTPLCW
jgi:hypothetical protein